jgi:hypothetical protein
LKSIKVKFNFLFIRLNGSNNVFAFQTISYWIFFYFWKVFKEKCSVQKFKERFFFLSIHIFQNIFSPLSLMLFCIVSEWNWIKVRKVSFACSFPPFIYFFAFSLSWARIKVQNKIPSSHHVTFDVNLWISFLPLTTNGKHFKDDD